MRKDKRATEKGSRSKIFIVDDQPAMRQDLAQLIKNEPDLDLCGEAEEGGVAMEQMERLQPDLAIIDISLRSGRGLELIKDLQLRQPKMPVLVISAQDESSYADRVFRAGGRGYVMKQAGGKSIMEAIRQVLTGQTYVSPTIANNILNSFAGRGQASTSPVDSLSDREFQVFELIGRGCATKEIAAKLHISVKTVEVHRVNVKQKLNVAKAAELKRYAATWTESQRSQ